MAGSRGARIYTRTGDRGETSLLGGLRVSKDSLKVSTYGTVDETSAAIALGRSMARCGWVHQVASRVLGELITVAAELARPEPPGVSTVTGKMTDQLERDIDEGLNRLPPLRGFVISGQTPAEAAFDLARTVARRAERQVVGLSKRDNVRGEVIRYLNRLSDLLYVLARVEAQEQLVQAVKQRVLEIIGGGGAMNKAITLEKARQITEAAELKARQIKVPMVITVVDDAGNPILLQRMDGALLASLDIAVGKAYTAVSLKMETAALSPLAAPGGPLYGINTTNRGRIVPFGGGLPIYLNDIIVGAIGVSGGSVEKDIEVARAGVEKWLQIK